MAGVDPTLSSINPLKSNEFSCSPSNKVSRKSVENLSRNPVNGQTMDGRSDGRTYSDENVTFLAEG